ncbi:uncharacterized protein LOC144650259 isoform X3 [Oculina patagonica]
MDKEGLHFKKELARSEGEVKKRDMKLETVMNEMASLNNTIISKDEELTKTKNEMASLNNTIISKDEELRKTKNEIASLNNEISIRKKEVDNALIEVLETKRKDCKNCRILRKHYKELMLECQQQDNFRKDQLNKVRLQANVYLQMANDHKWQNDVLRQRLNALTQQSTFKPP